MKLVLSKVKFVFREVKFVFREVKFVFREVKLVFREVKLVLSEVKLAFREVKFVFSSVPVNDTKDMAKVLNELTLRNGNFFRSNSVYVVLKVYWSHILNTEWFSDI